MTVAVHGTQQQQQPPASAPNPDRNGVLPPHGSLGLPNNGTQQQPSTSSAPIPISAAPPNPQQSGSSAQESNVTGSTDESAPSQEASQVPPSAENIPRVLLCTVAVFESSDSLVSSKSGGDVSARTNALATLPSA
uniref:(northern house mosquito) hypothetical protein n=1 Tax=Culex pipiens TaxID=7175 RepID=A0A8D8CVR6_CULPI